MSRARIETVDALRSLYPPPVGPSAKKVMPSLEKHSRRFLELCPFLVLATAGDASPKGDPPGFVRVLDDKTILIPDRVGNNRVDSMQNVLADPRVALLCFLPGLNETLRINGRAEITADPELLAPSAVRGKAPKTGLVVHIDEVFMHCANAVLRAHLWDPAHHIDRAQFPPIGQVYADHIGRSEEGEAIEKLYAATHNDAVLY
ncbi:MAG: pyridoxamine 5'-phosphate oxidase family protein [Alphaproteobacteria bacterium]|nr:pyridoxamine 5'-phosphate oxidase family protein [Candidatus Odyssella sp.]